MRNFALLYLALLLLPSLAAAQAAPGTDRDAAVVYQILSGQPVSARRVLFRSVTPEMKAALWRVHVRHFVDSHPELTNTQRVVISQFVTLLTADLYQARGDDPDWEAAVGIPFSRMQESASAILSAKLYREAFAVLGPPDYAEEPNEAIATVDRSSRASRSSMQPTYCVGCYAPDCECNLGDNWCAWGQTCFGDNCKSDSWGCGTAWQKICNGMCR